MSRKRRHSRAFPAHEDDDDDDHEPFPPPTGDNGSSCSHESGQQDDSGKLEKEPEIWDAFREENYEAIEQLPLSLHRQFILMKELDQQAHGYNSDLLPTLRKYISLRQSIAPHHELQFSENLSAGLGGDAIPLAPQDGLSDPPLVPSTLPDVTVFSTNSLNGTPALSHSQWGSARGGYDTPQPLKKVYAISETAPSTPTLMPNPPERVKSPQTTREMLSHIGWLSEELLRASEEKVNLAQAGCDSVDRHIRLLDQAIKEQEASISLDIRSGTHLAPILLPDLVVPRWARPSRVTHSPMPTISGAADGETEETDSLLRNVSQGGPTPLIVSLGEPDEPRAHSHKKGKKGNGKSTRKKLERDNYAPEPLRRGVRSLKLTVSTPARSAAPPPGLVVDPNERRYCYCNQVSYGEMIGCDAKGCEREWFHWGCVGLKKAPNNKSKWYCPDCAR